MVHVSLRTAMKQRKRKARALRPLSLDETKPLDCGNRKLRSTYLQCKFHATGKVCLRSRLPTTMRLRLRYLNPLSKGVRFPLSSLKGNRPIATTIILPDKSRAC